MARADQEANRFSMSNAIKNILLGPAAVLTTPAGREPLLDFSQLTPQPGIARGVASFASGMTTPENLALMAGSSGLGAVASDLGKTAISKLVSLGFSSQMIADAARQSPTFVKQLTAGDFDQAKQTLTSMVLEGGTAALGVRHGISAEPSTVAPTERMARGALMTQLPGPALPPPEPLNVRVPPALRSDIAAETRSELGATATALPRRSIAPPTVLPPNVADVLLQARNAEQLGPALNATVPSSLQQVPRTPGAVARGPVASQLKLAIESRAGAAAPPPGPTGVPSEAAAHLQAVEKALHDANLDPSAIREPGDVTTALNQAADQIRQHLDPRATASLSLTTQRGLAADLNMTVDELLSRRSGSPLNSEQLIAARGLLRGSQARVLALAGKAAADESASGEFTSALAQHQMILDSVRGATSEAGRALGSLRIGESELPTARLTRTMAALPPAAQLKAAKLLARIDPNNAVAVNRLIDQMTPATTGDKVYEYYINSLLSGGSAQIVKTSSDIAMRTLAPLTKVLSAGLDLARATATGTPRQRFFGEATADLYGSIAGARHAFDSFASTFQNETRGHGGEWTERPQPVAIKGLTGQLVRLPTRVLAAVTDGFQALGYASQLHATAYRLAAGEGLQGDTLGARAAALVAHPTDVMRTEASKFAARSTFMEDLSGPGAFNKIGSWALKLKQTPLRWLTPFVKVPLNLMREGARLSPAGLIGTAKGAISGDVKGGELSDALARNTLGTGIWLWAISKAMSGDLTGSGPTNYQDRQRLEAAGWQKDAIRVGDHFINYRRLEPVGFSLGAAADFVEAMRRNPDDPALATRFSEGISATAKNALDISFLDNFTRMVASAKTALESGQGIRTAAARAGIRAAGTVIPQGVANVARMTDRVQRNPQTLSEELMSRLPGLSRQVPPRVGPGGQVMLEPGSRAGGINPYPWTRIDPRLASLGRAVEQRERIKALAAARLHFGREAARKATALAAARAAQANK